MTTPFSRHLKTLTAALLGSLIVTVAHAGDKHTVSDTSHTTKTIQKHVIKVQAGGAEIIEADVSNLAPGEARSYTTDSGHMVDILKGIDGIEIYLDGTLIETEFGAEAHAATMAQRHEWLEACT